MLTLCQRSQKLAVNLVLCGLFALTACQNQDHPACYSLKDSFKALEGRYTKYWTNSITRQDKQLLQVLEPIYRKLAHQQFLKVDEPKIPKTLHFIWLGPKNFPAESVKFVRSWLTKHPDWQVIFWTDRFRVPPCSHMQIKMVQNFDWKYLKDYYDQTQNWAEKSDYLRYEILLAHGGVYVDHDIYCHESFDPMVHQYHFFAGLELPHYLLEGYTITACNALLGSIPHHPLLYELIRSIKKVWDTAQTKFCQQSSIECQLVMQRSYMPLTYAIQSKIASAPGDNIIFPAAYFYSKSSLPPFYARHEYAGTWGISKPEKAMHKTIDVLKRFRSRCCMQKQRIKGLLVLNGLLALYMAFMLLKRRKKPA